MTEDGLLASVAGLHDPSLVRTCLADEHPLTYLPQSIAHVDLPVGL